MEKALKKLVITVIALVSVLSSAEAMLQVIPARPNAGASIGKAFGEGIARGLEEARLIQQEKEHREELRRELEVAAEIENYNTVFNQLFLEKTHPTITLSDDLKKPIEKQLYLKLSDKRKMGCIFKGKFHRVISNGTLVEWLWSLNITNETPRKLFSSGNMEYKKMRIKIELLDSNDFVVSSCVVYNDLFLKRGESTIVQGKWIIPYDQVSQVSNFRISMGG